MSDCTGLLEFIASRCQCEVSVEINSHRNFCESVLDYLRGPDDSTDDIAPDVLNEMVARNSLVVVQFYPDTPIGFYAVRHYDLKAALQIAADIVAGLDK
jgi:ferritin-like protein